MGYTAQLMTGHTIHVPRESLTTFVELVEDWEQSEWVSQDGRMRTTHTHLSWCRPVATYGTSPEQVSTLFFDYGFDGMATSDGVYLSGWQGDKIGSSWDDLWDILAKVVASDVTWVMQGEDGHLWAEIIENGTHRQAGVTITIETGGEQ